MEIKSRIIPAKPRNKELYFLKGIGGTVISSSSNTSSYSPTYWELITEDDNGNPLAEPYLKTKYSAVSEKGISALGLGDDGGESGGVVALSELVDTSVDSRVPGDILVYNGTHWENRPQSSIVSPSLVLGETFSTAYRGDRGKIAYDHSQVTGNPHNTTFAQLWSKPTTLSGFGITDAVTSTVFNNHKDNNNDEKHLTQAQLTNLINLSNWWKLDAENDAIYSEKSVYSLKGVSALGLGSEGGGSGGGGVNMLQSWDAYTSDKANYYVPASLLVPFRNDTLSRLASLESGSATSIITTGSGNAITSLTKSGSVITANKGLTFALSSHTHTIAQISGLQNALDLKAPLSNPTFTGNVTAPAFIGALSGNASSATKLQTARTIWGQSFNGEGNVLGALTSATTGSFSTSVSTPKVIFAAAGWSLEQVGTELQMKHNGVVKQRMLSDGTILATGGLTALSSGTIGKT